MNPSRKPRPRGFVLITALLLGIAALIAITAIAIGAAAAWYWRDLPPLDKAVDYRPLQHLQVYTADGADIAQFGSERRIFVPLAQMPPLLPKAVIAVEDRQFYAHGGISFRGLARALISNLTGHRAQGASTITQQVARTFFLSTRRTAERKIKEAMLALELERKLGKDQILELYLNQIYMGQHAYGMAAAAQVYFYKTLAQLSLAEIAMIADIQNNPGHANPITNLAAATERQHWVLSRMVLTGAITEAQAAQARAQKLVIHGPSFVDVHAEHVAEMARRAVVERLGDQAYTAGVKVYTSLRADDQRAAYAAVRRAVMAYARKQPWRGPEDQVTLPDDASQTDAAVAQAFKDLRDDDDLRVAIVTSASPREIVAQTATGETVTLRGDALRWVQRALAPQAAADIAIRRGAVVRLVAQTAAPGKPAQWSLAQWPEVEAAFVAVDPATGRVRALVGGFDFNRQQFNHVTAGARQPGSSFKPFVYSAAFENGVMPETLVDDAPLTNADGSEPNWNPQDYEGHFDGWMTVREGLIHSKNLVSIRLLMQTGLETARSWIARFGFDMSKQPDNLTLALGSGSVTPLQMALSYSVFANGGHRIAPVVIEKIVDGQGKVLYQAPPPAPLAEADRVVPARNVFLVNSLLADVTLRGTAARAHQVLQRPDLYGKTGTTNDAVDAWFAGFAPGVAAVAWMGYDDPASLGEGESGGGLALPIWIDSMKQMLHGVPVQPLATYLPAEGIIQTGDDWRYSEYAEGGFITRVGAPPAGVDAAAAAASASTASDPLGALISAITGGPAAPASAAAR
ncbi:MAG: PBP1A family penicillin-binding protein [Burkholderiales bacterium]|nr:PBP1A family penicillin-binding protein [Burkholderiales bacterium]